ncbi:MAG: VOC family protein [Planctomycetaceae bacterium]
MKIEHLAVNVEDPLSMARWYVENLGFTVRRRIMEPPWAHFLADDSGAVMIEIYGNDSVPLPDYRTMHPGSLHLALISEDVEQDLSQLCAAGATEEGNIQNLPNGDSMAFVRDPWGLTLQLVRRGEPMI